MMAARRMYLTAKAVPGFKRSSTPAGRVFPKIIPTTMPSTTGLMPVDCTKEVWAVKVAIAARTMTNAIPGYTNEIFFIDNGTASLIDLALKQKRKGTSRGQG